MTPTLTTRIAMAARCLRGDMTGIRQVLPWRRHSETFKFEHSGFKWFANFSRYADGHPAEIFLSTAKSGTLMQAMANDMATVASIAFQHGASLAAVRKSLTRNGGEGEPATPLSAALDIISES